MTKQTTLRQTSHQERSASTQTEWKLAVRIKGIRSLLNQLVTMQGALLQTTGDQAEHIHQASKATTAKRKAARDTEARIADTIDEGVTQ
jgi:hypothetical protein